MDRSSKVQTLSHKSFLNVSGENGPTADYDQGFTTTYYWVGR